MIDSGPDFLLWTLITTIINIFFKEKFDFREGRKKGEWEGKGEGERKAGRRGRERQTDINVDR